MEKRFIIFLAFLITFKGITQVPSPPSNPATDIDKSWVFSRLYDANGNIITESKKFFDGNGRLIQSQSKVKYKLSSGTVVNHVFATQPVYDALGRPLLSTMPAPINNSEFKYAANFIQNSSGTAYDYKNYDSYQSGSSFLDKTTPDALGGQSTIGTLAWYYSTNNTWEPYTPTTNYPFSTSAVYKDGTGAGKKTAGTGEVFKMGNGREVESYITPVVSELDQYIQVRNKYFSTTEVGTLGNLTLNAVQTIGKDQNGKEAVIITDRSGKKLMAARPGTDLQVTNSNMTLYGYPYRLIINPGTTTATTLNFTKFKITGLGKGRIYSGGTQVYTGLIANYVQPSSVSTTGPYTLIIDSDSPFTCTYEVQQSGTVIAQGENTQPQDLGYHIYYLKLFNSSTVTFTAGQSYTAYKVIRMSDETVVLDKTASGLGPGSYTGTFAAGYYKVVAYEGDLALQYTNSYTDISYYFYNQLGQLVATIAPEGVKKLLGTGINNYATRATVPFITTYEYDLQGRLIASTSPDSKRGQLVYRKDGKIRFSQNAEQFKTLRYSYTNYDKYGRPVESGEYQPDANGMAFNPDMSSTAFNPMKAILEDVSSTGGLTTGIKYDIVKTKYDVTDISHGQVGYTQNDYFLRGAVSMTEKYSSINGGTTVLISRTWYNYTGEGKVDWSIQYIEGLGYKTIDYTYDVNGNLTKVVYQKNTVAETFVHYYEYDDNLRLSKVYTNTTDNSTTKTLQATYIYYLHGPLKRVELATNLQGIDYTYTLQGQLKAINNPNKTNDPGQDSYAGSNSSILEDAFGMSLDYYPGDYKNDRTTGYREIKNVSTGSIVATESYAGNIKAMTWRSKKPVSVPLTDAPNTYVFKYDNKYQFTESTWGTTLNYGTAAGADATFTTTTFNKEKILTGTGNPAYDANGNILNLYRTNTTGAVLDNFTYNYTANTNKLASISNTAPGSNTTFSAYVYDDVGQLTSEVVGDANRKTKYIKYDVTGKVIGVYANYNPATGIYSNPIAEFSYNENGFRIAKKTYNSSGVLLTTTFYVQDEAGVDFGIYVKNGSTTTLEECSVYGADRIATYYRQSNIYAFELTDHLENVRAVIAKNGTTLDVRMYSDYYPFGYEIQRGGTTYRDGYQGKYAEKDEETGWNAFELRMYDSRIGRWLSVDPKAEFWSPYVGMGNNVINLTDPDGGGTDPWEGCASCAARNIEMAEVRVTGHPDPLRQKNLPQFQWWYYRQKQDLGFTDQQIEAWLKNKYGNDFWYLNKLYSAQKWEGYWKRYQEIGKAQNEGTFLVLTTIFAPEEEILVAIGSGLKALRATPLVSKLISKSSGLIKLGEKAVGKILNKVDDVLIDTHFWGNLKINEIKTDIIKGTYGAINKYLSFSQKKTMINAMRNYTEVLNFNNLKNLTEILIPGKTFHF